MCSHKWYFLSVLEICLSVYMLSGLAFYKRTSLNESFVAYLLHLRLLTNLHRPAFPACTSFPHSASTRPSTVSFCSFTLQYKGAAAAAAPAGFSSSEALPPAHKNKIKYCQLRSALATCKLNTQAAKTTL